MKLRCADHFASIWKTLTVCLAAASSFGGTAAAQVIQLPSFSRFSISTTVKVPDRGSASLGGVSRAAQSSSNRGASRSLSDLRSTSDARVQVTILDFDHWDRSVLDRAAMRREGLPKSDDQLRGFGLARQLDRQADGPDAAGGMSLAALRARSAAQKQQERQLQQQQLARAEQVWLEGDTERARLAFRLAWDEADADQRPMIVERFRRLQRSTANGLANHPPGK